MKIKGKTDVETCIFIECPQEELERRVLHRGQTSGKTIIYYAKCL
jgi:hypothetical protein